jgi:hypothetical protein
VVFINRVLFCNKILPNLDPVEVPKILSLNPQRQAQIKHRIPSKPLGNHDGVIMWFSPTRSSLPLLLASLMLCSSPNENTPVSGNPTLKRVLIPQTPFIIIRVQTFSIKSYPPESQSPHPSSRLPIHIPPSSNSAYLLQPNPHPPPIKPQSHASSPTPAPYILPSSQP